MQPEPVDDDTRDTTSTETASTLVGSVTVESALHRLLQAAPDAIIVVNDEGYIVLVNRQVERMFGYPRAELLGHPVEILIAERFRDRHGEHCKHYFQSPRIRPMNSTHELYGRKKNGTEFPLEIGLGPLDARGETLALSIIRDATTHRNREHELEEQTKKLEQANRLLEELVTRDGLTGLRNHRAFREKMEEEFERAVRYGTPLSVLMIDIDHFKEYNDTFGHPAGDKVLKAIARLLENNARQIDFVARYGGEEFVVVLPHCDAQGAVISAERVRAAVEAAPWPSKVVAVSIGVASLKVSLRNAAPPQVSYSSSTDLLEAADRALYESKRQGRNRVTLADATRLSEEVQ